MWGSGGERNRAVWRLYDRSRRLKLSSSGIAGLHAPAIVRHDWGQVIVEIIRVEQPASGGVAAWADWAWETAKERPYLALPVLGGSAVVAAPFIATSAATIAAGVAVGGVATGFSERIWGPDAKPPVTLYTVEEAKSMTDVHGQPLMRATTYMRHPRPSQQTSIIASSEFHSFIIRQKVAEIIHYVRAEALVRSLSILVRSAEGKHVLIDGNLEELPIKLEVNAAQRSANRMMSTYEDPIRLIHEPSYVWMNDFPEIIAATRNAGRGTMAFSQSTDMSFGMSGGVAKFAGFKAGWLSTFTVDVEATFA